MTLRENDDEDGMTPMVWPTDEHWQEMDAGERIIEAAALLAEAHDRAFSTGDYLSDNEQRAMFYLSEALEKAGYHRVGRDEWRKGAA